MVLPADLKVGSPTEYKHQNGMPLGTFKKGPSFTWLPGGRYEFETTPPPGSDRKSKGLSKEQLGAVNVWTRTPAERNASAFDLAVKWANRGAPAGGRRRTHRMMFKKWAAQEAREMSHKGKRMTFRKWAAHELKEKSHPGNPSFKKWARQEMREKSHTRRRR